MTLDARPLEVFLASAGAAATSAGASRPVGAGGGAGGGGGGGGSAGLAGAVAGFSSEDLVQAPAASNPAHSRQATSVFMTAPYHGADPARKPCSRKRTIASVSACAAAPRALAGPS